MDTWLIIVLVLVALVVLALIAFLAPRRRQARTEKRRAEAERHLHDAQLLSARAEQGRATAEEQAARARRERAEVEERVARDEAEAARLAARAENERIEAERLQQRARKLAPDLQDPSTADQPGHGTPPPGEDGQRQQPRVHRPDPRQE